MKYILVTGGVISGIGKGIISSSIGTILKAYGWNVTCIKIDPYLNIDAGTFSPYEHGEVYVLDDGSEVDLDLGNYERFLDITLTKDNNITTGKIYQRVMEKERRGDYLGKTVQVVPHITDTIMQWVVDVAQIPVDESGQVPEVCIIELGGTIGDIESMPFVEAFRQMLFRVGCSNFCCVHVSLVPQLSSVGEPKTKPTQASVRELRACGLHPDLIMCRCTSALPKAVIDKISLFSQVPVERVLTVMDVGDLYEVPIRLDKQGICRILLEHFRLSVKPKIEHPVLGKWQALTQRLRQATRPVRVAVVGKYTKLNDAYISLLKALRHAAIYADCKLDTDLVCCESLEEHVRLSSPDQFHQAWLVCAVIEFARNVLGWKDANTTEFDPDCKHPVVIDMPEYNPGHMGGTMRLGRRRTAFYLSDTAATYVNQTYGNSSPLVTGCGDGPVMQPSPTSSTVHRLINAPFFDARHRHRYEVNPTVVDELEAAGLIVVGRDAEVGDRMEVIELMRPLSTVAMQNDHFPDPMTSGSNKIRPPTSQSGPVRHPYFVATQFHPEYTSRPAHPSMFFVGLILAASNQLDSYLHSPFRLSPTVLLEELNGRGSSVAFPTGSSLYALEDKSSEHNHISYVNSLTTALASSNLNSDSELDAALTRPVNFQIGDCE
ncbi:hypothetical protein EG68_05134 [Paragonimus skrjabini miyazakii]|uniref:CTP synthase (glutamine hydrolyzing) n=1 Tax=Paragonimus skrjabini miyazakii TaxID=59628 RepID=A0A8S9Z1V8_9TREM|nr:hypothetical protein EG68_05134 [Paragonimus skrjabini miyazakii]